MGKIFISYSRKNLEKVKDLYKKLKELGHSLWMDEEDLLAGQIWENEVKKVISNAQAVLICLSSKWISERGYVQKELKMVLDAMGKIPEGEIFLIPIKLDNCTTPQSIEKVHWVNLYETNGFEKLQKSLNALLNKNVVEADMTGIEAIDAFSEFKENMITRGMVIYDDPWETAHSSEEKEFKDLLKGKWDKGMDYWESKEYHQIISLWEPLFDHPFFIIDHDEWNDKPFFRAQIHSAKCQLFMAYVQLGQTESYETYVPLAFAMIKEVLTANPYSMRGPSSTTLESTDAKVQNLNYKDALIFAQQWFRGWSEVIMLKTPIEESKNVEERITQRLYEINFILNLRQSKS